MSAVYLLNPLSYYETILMHIHLIVTMCLAKVLDTVFQGQSHRIRSKVTCTGFKVKVIALGQKSHVQYFKVKVIALGQKSHVHNLCHLHIY